MPRFSLIVATIGRTSEFSVLLESLAKQEMRSFELIVVDQNPDDRLSALLDKWTSMIAGVATSGEIPSLVKHLRCPPGVSRARNVGLRHSTGDILAFPDDDCWYLSDTLKNVDEWFCQHKGYGILSVGSKDEKGRASGNHWVQADCDLSSVNIFRTSATYAYFVRRPSASIPLLFDESLGPGAGTVFGCGEDTDFLLTLMRYGVRGRFCSALYVGHPFREGFVDADRAVKYGGGFGGVLAKHSLLFLFVGFVAFDLTRAAVQTLVGNRRRGAQLWAHGLGMIRAYWSRKRR
jgi:glycosyltransferase involved in cell wall biosynthesis